MFHYIERPFECIFYILSIPKSNLDQAAEMLFLGVYRRQLIIFLLDVLKNDISKVDEAMFRGVERPYELIFYFLCIEKIDLDEVD
jgi:hypothetical protein